MEKKLWSNAEVVELGVESTREEGVDENFIKIFACKHCGQKFWTKGERNSHEKICGLNPCNKPSVNDPNIDPDFSVVPLS